MITPEMSIAEVMRMDPEVAPVFMSYGMHCLYCPHASAESIAEASMVHGIDANALVAALPQKFELTLYPESTAVFEAARELSRGGLIDLVSGMK